MSKYTEFFDYVDETICSMPDNIKQTFDELREMFEQEAKSKPLFTEIGLEILKYLQSCGVKRIKAKEIAEGMDTTSRKVSGGIRKLVTDGFVDKSGQNPVIYTLTEKGKNFDLETYIKENNDEEEH